MSFYSLWDNFSPNKPIYAPHGMIGKHDKICRLTVKLLRNFRKKAFLSALQDNKQPIW